MNIDLCAVRRRESSSSSSRRKTRWRRRRRYVTILRFAKYHLLTCVLNTKYAKRRRRWQQFIYSWNTRGVALRICAKIETCEMKRAVNRSISFNTYTRTESRCRPHSSTRNTVCTRYTTPSSSDGGCHFVVFILRCVPFSAHTIRFDAYKCTDKLSGF